MGLQIGVDVGGTFTDFLVMDDLGNAEIYKTSTTPLDPSVGFFRGLEKAASARSVSLDEFLREVKTIVHGTTITTNAALTGNGALTGFITTEGFRDVLNMRRGIKERQFEKYAPPPELIPRHRIKTVRERISVDGEILTPLNEDDVRLVAQEFREKGIEAVAVSFLWSFLHPEHEHRVREILASELPDAYVSLSTEVLPQIRVYERHSTTVLNAYVGPVLTRYLSRLDEELTSREFDGHLLIMQSNGGVMSPEMAQRFASNTLLSGPAGGPMAGVYYGNTHKFRNIITIDMGGTSFDIALIKDAEPTVTTEGMVGDHRIASPILDIHTIGAGGGSIAWIDGGGLIHVGPNSAGAEPGPACYGRGGAKPTVTDAQFMLGYLDPALFEKGEIQLDAEAARHAIEEEIAGPLNMGVAEAASGIYQIVNNNMAAALGVVSVRRGNDPRDFVLVVAGGAGPIHAAAIARELDIPLILIPRESSVFCAAGMLISDLKHDYVRTYARDLGKVDISDIKSIYQEMVDNARQTLSYEGVANQDMDIAFSVDLRYVGQFHEVEAPVKLNTVQALGDKHLEDMENAFHKQHDTLYGYSMRGTPLELINLRVTARGYTEQPSIEKVAFGGEDPATAKIGMRKAWFDGGFSEVPIYDGLKLMHGHRVPGPSIVVQPTTTIVIPPDFDLTCDEFNNYLMSPKGRDVATLCRNLQAGG